MMVPQWCLQYRDSTVLLPVVILGIRNITTGNYVGQPILNSYQPMLVHVFSIMVFHKLISIWGVVIQSPKSLCIGSEDCKSSDIWEFFQSGSSVTYVTHSACSCDCTALYRFVFLKGVFFANQRHLPSWSIISSYWGLDLFCF